VRAARLLLGQQVGLLHGQLGQVAQQVDAEVGGPQRGRPAQRALQVPLRLRQRADAAIAAPDLRQRLRERGRLRGLLGGIERADRRAQGFAGGTGRQGFGVFESGGDGLGWHAVDARRARAPMPPPELGPTPDRGVPGGARVYHSSR